MNPSPTVTKIKYVGLDVHAETIAVAIADSSGAVRAYGTVPAHSHSVDRLVKKLAEDGMEVRYVYEAGPTGFWLCRHLRGKGIPCEVIAPSLIPQKASDRVKTDRRDALNLARLFRSGELTSVRVPDEADEAIRDLVRTRLATVEDLRRCRQRIKGYMLRYGRRYDGKSSWNPRHLNYLSLQKFDHPAQQIAFEELLNAIKDPADRIERLDAAIETQVKSWKREPLVRALMCFRGLALLNATTLVCELGDLTRFDSPGPLISFVGLVPTEDSSGKRRRQGAVTKSGNSAARRALVEAAWQYRLPARVTTHPPTTARSTQSSHRHRLEGSATPLRTLSILGQRGKEERRGRDCRGARTGGLHLGRGNPYRGNPIPPGDSNRARARALRRRPPGRSFMFEVVGRGRPSNKANLRAKTLQAHASQEGQDIVHLSRVGVP